MKKLFLLLFILLGCQQDEVYYLDASTTPVVSIVLNKTFDKNKNREIPIKHENILLIGDSQVLYAKWFFKPFKNSNETVWFDTKPGTTIGWWNDGVFHQEIKNYPTINTVIVFLGTNNFNFPYLQPINNILNEIKSRNLNCIWVGPTAVYGKKHIINSLIKEAVSDTCIYVNTEDLGIELQDGVHPTQAGMTKWLTEIWRIKA